MSQLNEWAQIYDQNARRLMKGRNDDIDAALALVLDMAWQGAVDMYDNPSEYRRQKAAIQLIKETFNKSGERPW